MQINVLLDSGGEGLGTSFCLGKLLLETEWKLRDNVALCMLCFLQLSQMHLTLPAAGDKDAGLRGDLG